VLQCIRGVYDYVLYKFTFYLLTDLGTTYGVHLRLTGKCVVNFLLVLIELFLLWYTTNKIRVIQKSVRRHAKNVWKHQESSVSVRLLVPQHQRYA